MGEPEFTPELVKRCGVAIGRDYEMGHVYDENIIAVLRESGHAELVRWVKSIRPMIAFFSGKNAQIVAEIAAALRKAGAL